MAAVTVERTDSPTDALAAAGPHLATDPIRHNLVLTLLQSRAAHPEPGRYWVVRDGDRPAGLVLQSPLEFAATATPMAAAAIAAAVDAIATAGVRLPGVTGEALTAARFAGQWTERTGTGAWPVQGQRIYEVDEVVAAPPPGGRDRIATEEDLELVTRWFAAFGDEIGDSRGDLATLVARRLERRPPLALGARRAGGVRGRVRPGGGRRPDRPGVHPAGPARPWLRVGPRGCRLRGRARPGHALHPLHGPGQPHRELGLPEARLPRRRRSAALPLRRRRDGSPRPVSPGTGARPRTRRCRGSWPRTRRAWRRGRWRHRRGRCRSPSG